MISLDAYDENGRGCQRFLPKLLHTAASSESTKVACNKHKAIKCFFTDPPNHIPSVRNIALQKELNLHIDAKKSF